MKIKFLYYFLCIFLFGFSNVSIAKQNTENLLGPHKDTVVKLQKHDTSTIRDDLLRELTYCHSIEQLMSGTIPDPLVTEELFLVDITNEVEVEKKRQLFKDFITDNNGIKIQDFNLITHDKINKSSYSELEKYQKVIYFKLAKLRLEFLDKPLSQRLLVLDAERVSHNIAQAAEEVESAELKALQEQKAAEQRQKLAIKNAQVANDEYAKMLANERAKLEGLKVTLSKLKTALLQKSSDVLDRNTTRTYKKFKFRESERKALFNSEEALALYNKMILEVDSARHDLSVILDKFEDNISIPSVQLSAELFDESNSNPSYHKAIQELQSLLSEVDELKDGLIDLAKETRWNEALSSFTYANEIHKISLLLIEKLPKNKRYSVLSISDDGKQQFWREVFHIKLLLKWAMISAVPQLSDLLEHFKEPLFCTICFLKIFTVIFVLIFAWLSIARGLSLLNSLATRFGRSENHPVLGGFLSSVVLWVKGVWKELVLLVTSFLLSYILYLYFNNNIINTTIDILTKVLWYKLFIKVAFHSIIWLSDNSLGSVSEVMTNKILQSIRLIGKSILYLVVFLEVSESLLGKAYLYHIALKIGLLGIFPIVVILIEWWRSAIVRNYLAQKPHPLLAHVLTKASTSWYSFFVVMIAVILMFINWVMLLSRRFVLSFEQTRIALAYIFRIRLEKHQDEYTNNLSDIILPKPVAEVLVNRPILEGKYFLHRDSSLEDFMEDFMKWENETNHIGSYLVVGKTGFGKTSWIKMASDNITSLPTLALTLQMRTKFDEDVISYLSNIFSANSNTLEDLISFLLDQPRSVIIIDDLHNIIMRGDRGLIIWDVLCTIIERTGHHIFWLCTFAHYSYEFLEWARKGKDVFRSVMYLSKWTEKDILSLLENRMNDIGYKVFFDSLVSKDKRLHTNIKVCNTAKEYARLIWDYSEGNPSVALQCWMDSLIPLKNKTLSVKLFGRPDEVILDQLNITECFVLASVIWHENISTVLASQSLRYTPLKCEDALRKLSEFGVLRKEEDSYIINIEWLPLVVRYLRRQQLISS